MLPNRKAILLPPVTRTGEIPVRNTSLVHLVESQKIVLPISADNANGKILRKGYARNAAARSILLPNSARRAETSIHANTGCVHNAEERKIFTRRYARNADART